MADVQVMPRKIGIVGLDQNQIVDISSTERMMNGKNISLDDIKNVHLLRPFCGMRIITQGDYSRFVTVIKLELGHNGHLAWHLYDMKSCRRGMYFYPTHAFDWTTRNNLEGTWELLIEMSIISAKDMPNDPEKLGSYFDACRFSPIGELAFSVYKFKLDLKPTGERKKAYVPPETSVSVSIDDI